MTKNHEPTIWTRIGWHFENYGFTYAVFGALLLALSLLGYMGVADQQRIDAKQAAQQACVLHGKVPAEVYGKIICVAPEALR